ncbi:Transcription factor Adf-1-like 2 [Homarus americanus]|uniref:Transcription factor Adf-1-like 2 n=1 Tax=Homarus americanus TaxID=6706 RepID=A0A8J5JG20_HOMAM|nr:Transcription factor Adf-1-like 2 [Homarus americanus]
MLTAAGGRQPTDTSRISSREILAGLTAAWRQPDGLETARVNEDPYEFSSVFGIMDERLIEVVRGYEELFDMTNKKYSDNLHKDKIWKVIGEAINKPGHECKLRWGNLRDQYRRYLRKINTKSGQEAVNVTKWRYADEMSFIKPFLRDRETMTSLEEETVNTVVTEETESGIPCSKNKRGREAGQTLSDEEASSIQSEAATRRRSRPPAKKFVHIPETPSFVLMKHLIESESQKGGNPPDAVDLFFQSISATVKKFSPYHQNICKTKVLALVSELELIELADQSSQSSATSSAFASGTNLSQTSSFSPTPSS